MMRNIMSDRCASSTESAGAVQDCRPPGQHGVAWAERLKPRARSTTPMGVETRSTLDQFTVPQATPSPPSACMFSTSTTSPAGPRSPVVLNETAPEAPLKRRARIEPARSPPPLSASRMMPSAAAYTLS